MIQRPPLKDSTKIFLNKAPFLKLLIPLIAGIAIQSIFNFQISTAITLAGIAVLFFIAFSFLPEYKRLKFSWLKSIAIFALTFSLGMFLFVVKDIRQNKNWFGHFYKQNDVITAVLTENPVEKENSYKAEALVKTVMDSASARHADGRIIIYFRKDSAIKSLEPGTELSFKKPLQEIKNSGNPGGFDYKRYALYNGIVHTVYLTEQDFILSSGKRKIFFKKTLHALRQYAVQTIRKYIPGKKEQGLAEALLIGYKDDLDRDLLQSYTNTGVVHVIAVSGMHLGLIFWLLNLLFKPLLKRRKTAWMHPVLIICLLWVFTLIAGGSASIVRAAVMFTFILLGTAFNRKASIYNTLAVSAFLLLCYNPYWLWDVGFQLSYIAVLSIVIFYKPIYHFLYLKNRSLDWIWQLLAVSLAAQILTTPVVLFHFHQFPVYFLITNLLIVPVSSLVLIGELILVLISAIPFLASALGKILSATIWWMNSVIEGLEKLPFSVWDGFQINLFQVVLLFVVIIAIAPKQKEERKKWIWIGLFALLAFFGIRAYSFYEASHQRKMIVYNISKHDAIDFIDGRNFKPMMDSSLHENKKLVYMNLKPARTLYRVKPTDSIAGLSITNNAISFFGKRILLVNRPINANTAISRTNVDVVILSANPRLYINDLVKLIEPKQIVISASAPAWKANYWQKDCDSLKIPCHKVAEKGAFVMNLR